jgi:hypothetical protein
MNRTIIGGIVAVILWIAGIFLEDVLDLCVPAHAGWGRKAALYGALAVGATWPYLFYEFCRARIGMAGKLRRTIERLIHSELATPKQIESVFVQSVSVEVDRMLKLTNQEPVENVNLETQYNYASGIAAHYVAHPVPTIAATALDVPSEFFREHHRYFTMQEPLVTSSREFLAFGKQEAINLDVLIEKATAGPWRHGGGPPAKARIVVIDEQTFAEELERDDFWKFVNWHVRHQFGLKFFLRELADDTYENLLAGAVDPNQDRTIDDFIVYGEGCVFGRVNPQARDKQAKLGFHYATEPSPEHGIDTVHNYRDFFVALWTDKDERLPDTHTLTELCEACPALRPIISAQKKRLQELKKLYDIERAYAT